MAKKDKILALAKGFRGRAKNCYRIATNRVEKALQYQYRDRRQKKRQFRSLWIQRINAAAREYDLSYSQLMYGLSQSNVQLDRKILSELAIYEPKSFAAVIEAAKESGVVNLIPEHARNSEPSEPEPLVVQAIARSTRNNPRTPQDAIDDVIGSVSQMKI